jgi:hypothetical protein
MRVTSRYSVQKINRQSFSIPLLSIELTKSELKQLLDSNIPISYIQDRFLEPSVVIEVKIYKESLVEDGK